MSALAGVTERARTLWRIIADMTVLRRRRVRRGFQRRAAWSALDQALSTTTNVLLGVVVARSVSLTQFGAFSAAYLTYVLCGFLSRAACSEVLLVRYSASPAVEQRRGIAASVGTAVLAGVVASAGCAVAALLTDGVLSSSLLALVVCMPGLLGQDAWRFAFFVQGRPRAAVGNDLLWAFVQFSLLGVLASLGGISINGAILAWGAGAYVCLGVGAMQAGIAPSLRFRSVRWWLRSHRDLLPRFVAESAIGRGSGQLTFVLVAAVTSLAAFGALRAGNLLLGPLNVLFASVAIVAIPEGVRLHLTSPDRLWPLCVSVAAAMAGMAAVVGAMLLVLPDSAGRAVLGESWVGAREVVLPLTVAAAALATQRAAVIGLRAMALAQDSLKVRAATAPLRLGSGTAGAALGGAVGAAWGLAFGETVSAVVYWRQLAVSQRDASSPSDTRATPSGADGPKPAGPGLEMEGTIIAARDE